MVKFNCRTTQESLTQHLAGATAVTQVDNVCVVTLPIPTVDGRLVDVFAEIALGDYCTVHDGGKAINELILQGIKITDSITQHFEALARRFKVSYTDEAFKTAVRVPAVQRAILSVGICSALAMAQLVGHIPVPVEEPLREQFGHTLKGWAKTRFKIEDGVTVQGGYAQRRFDFVAHPRGPQAPTVAMSVLLPGSNSLAAAERFGFKTIDLNATRKYKEWEKVAIQGRPECWSGEAAALLRRCAHAVIELPDQPNLDRQAVRQQLDLAAAA
jgi:hypothetical protein